MAWKRKHVEKSGRVTWYVQWRERVVDARGRAQLDAKGKPKTVVRMRSLGEVPAAVADAEVQVAMIEKEGRVPKVKLETTTHEAALDAFCGFWKTVRRRRADTIENYRRLLGPAFAWMAKRRSMTHWGHEDLTAYIATRASWSPRTVRMLVTACGTFGKWARRQKLAVPPFSEGVSEDLPRAVHVEKPAHSAADVARLIAAVARTKGRTRRYELPVALAFWAGMSLGDLQSLKRTAVRLDSDPGWLVGARSKTGVPFRIPLAKPLRALLEASAGEEDDGSGLLCPHLAKDSSSANHTIHRLCRLAGIPEAGGWKRLRHTFSTLLQEAGVDYATVEDLMAHRSGPSQTRVYTHSDDRRRKDAIRRLERLMARAAKAAAVE